MKDTKAGPHALPFVFCFTLAMADHGKLKKIYMENYQ
jgi:hypothetical protein